MPKFQPFIHSSMKKVLLISALTLGTIYYTSAQSPGYMGMRFFLKPDFSSIVAVSNPTANNQGGKDTQTEKWRFGLNTRFGIQAGYVLSRSLVAVLEGSHVNTGMWSQASTQSLIYPLGEDHHTLFYNIGGPEIGMSVQSYRLKRGSLAPLGAFWAARARVSFLSGEVKEHQTYYSGNNASAGHGPLGIDPRHTHVAVGAEFGANQIVADRILIGLSAELNLSVSRWFLAPSGLSYNQSSFIGDAAQRMSAHSLFLIKLGAGYIF